MDRRDFRGDLTPWSFFIPVALAAAVGVLVANAIGFAAGVIFPGHAAAEPSAPAAGPASQARPASTAGADAGGKPATAFGSTVVTATAAVPLPTLEPVRLPGPTSARRDGESRACISGTIALRAENGWQQEVVNDAPAHCLASSP